jgi:2-hydroxychromene-2-carboxylate isomerase
MNGVIEVTPVFLGGMHKLTGNAPPMIRDAQVKGKNEYAMLEMNRFITKHGLTKWQMNPKFPFNTITLQRMLIAIEPEKRGGFIEALLIGLWEQQLDATDMQAVAETIQKSGFDAQDLFARSQEPEIKQALIDNTAKAVERGAFGIPTFFVDDEMFFGKERLTQIGEVLAMTANK